jgi:hypothetical protein
MGKTKQLKLAQDHPPGACVDAAPTSARTDPDDFNEAASILDGQEGFGGALWDAEMRVAFDARGKIRDLPDSDRCAVFKSCMHDLRECLADEIERWAPQYVALAAAYPKFAKTTSTDWAHGRMRNIIDKRLRTPDLNGAIAFCLITMSGGNVEEKNQWQPPRWMFSGLSPEYGIRAEHKSVLRRLEHALHQTLAREKLRLIVATDSIGATHISSSQTSTKRGRPLDPLRERRRRIILKAIERGLVGKAYCDFLDAEGLETPPEWQYREKCPKRYRDAYSHSNAEERSKWRDRIADQKYKSEKTKRSTRQDSRVAS